MAWSPQSFPVSEVEKWRATNKWRHRWSSTSGLVVLWGAGVRLGCLGPPLQSPEPSSRPLTLQQDLLWDQQRLRWPHISQGFETAAGQDWVPLVSPSQLRAHLLRAPGQPLCPLPNTQHLPVAYRSFSLCKYRRAFWTSRCRLFKPSYQNELMEVTLLIIKCNRDINFDLFKFQHLFTSVIA